MSHSAQVGHPLLLEQILTRWKEFRKKLYKKSEECSLQEETKESVLFSSGRLLQDDFFAVCLHTFMRQNSEAWDGKTDFFESEMRF